MPWTHWAPLGRQSTSDLGLGLDPLQAHYLRCHCLPPGQGRVRADVRLERILGAFLMVWTVLYLLHPRLISPHALASLPSPCLPMRIRVFRTPWAASTWQ